MDTDTLTCIRVLCQVGQRITEASAPMMLRAGWKFEDRGWGGRQQRRAGGGGGGEGRKEVVKELVDGANKEEFDS